MRPRNVGAIGEDLIVNAVKRDVGVVDAGFRLRASTVTLGPDLTRKAIPAG